jgi:hypothetical protein
MSEVHKSLGTLQELFGIANPKTAPILKKAHKLILSLHPEAIVTPRLGEKSISYGFGPKKNTESYCCLMPFKEHVNLGFFFGVNIDPDGSLDGTGANMRHLKISSVAELASPRVTNVHQGSAQGAKGRPRPLVDSQ